MLSNESELGALRDEHGAQWRATATQSLRWPYAHIFILWLGPVLGWVALSRVVRLGFSGDWLLHLCGVLFAVWWAGCCVRWLGPPLVGAYGGDQGQMWSGQAYFLSDRWGGVMLWPGGAGVLVCLWQGWGGLMVCLLLFLAVLTWFSLLCRRVWIGKLGVWSFGGDIRYLGFATVRQSGWVEPLCWMAEREEGWPVQIELPDQKAADALEQAWQAHGHQEAAQPSPLPSPLLSPLPLVLWPVVIGGVGRKGLGVLLGISWCWLWGWWVWGPDVRIVAPWSLGSLGVLCMGVVVSRQISQWPPTWWVGAGRWGRRIWRWDDQASRLFHWGVVPSAGLALVLSSASLAKQILLDPALLFSVGTCSLSLLLISLSLLVLADPTGCVTWICMRGERLYLRRYGWVEEIETQ